MKTLMPLSIVLAGFLWAPAEESDPTSPFRALFGLPRDEAIAVEALLVQLTHAVSLEECREDRLRYLGKRLTAELWNNPNLPLIVYLLAFEDPRLQAVLAAAREELDLCQPARRLDPGHSRQQHLHPLCLRDRPGGLAGAPRRQPRAGRCSRKTGPASNVSPRSCAGRATATQRGVRLVAAGSRFSKAVRTAGPARIPPRCFTTCWYARPQAGSCPAGA